MEEGHYLGWLTLAGMDSRPRLEGTFFLFQLKQVLKFSSVRILQSYIVDVGSFPDSSFDVLG